MRWYLFALLATLSAALALGYGAVFLLRWGMRGLLATAIFSAVLAAAALAAHAAIPGRAARLAASLGYLLLATAAALSLVGAFKSDLLRDLLVLQLATGVVGLFVCAWPRSPEY